MTRGRNLLRQGKIHFPIHDLIGPSPRLCIYVHEDIHVNYRFSSLAYLNVTSKEAEFLYAR